MEILLILVVGSFIAYIIISTMRVWKFNKANAQSLPCSQSNVNNCSQESLFNTNENFDTISDPSFSSLSHNLYHK
ncbi:MAG: hypothetical protein E6Q33_03160 [Neisseriales bacterium]|nr:MAG: hypothetical protein E6Q33_03160 [Neisseriales bacterium]